MRTLAVLAALGALAAGCAPTVAYYDGGMARGKARTLEHATDIGPSEAGARFTTDYAPPEKNVTYAGATNRVRTDVPARIEPQFLTLTSSYAVQGVQNSTPTRSAGGAVNVSAHVEEKPSQVARDTSAAGSLAAPAQGAAMGGATGLTGGIRAAGESRAEVSEGLASPLDSKALAASVRPANAQGLGDSSAVQQPRVASQAASAGTARGVTSTDEPRGNRLLASESTPQATVDELAVKAPIETATAAHIEAVGQAMDATSAKGTFSSQQTRSAADKSTSAGARYLTGPEATKLLAERNALDDLIDARQALGAESTEGAVSYTWRHLRAVLTSSNSLAQRGTSRATAARENAGNVQGLEDKETGGEVARASSLADVTAARAVEQQVAAQRLSEDKWTLVPEGLEAVSPPALEVMKEGKLVKSADVKMLIERGILKDKPVSADIIRYRIYVFNLSESAAVDVRVLDRFDKGLALLPNSMWTTSSDAKAQYNTESRALEVTLPRLESQQYFDEYFMVEFYVEITGTP